MLVELEAEELGARVDLVPVDAGCERRLLQLLAHRFRLEPVEAGRSHEPTRVDEPRELVAGEERPLERRVPRQLQVLRMGKDGVDHLLGIALLAEDRGAILRVLVERRVDLVVEVVQQRDAAPELLVLATATRVAAHRGLDRERMTEQRLARRVVRQRRPGPLAGHLHEGA